MSLTPFVCVAPAMLLGALSISMPATAGAPPRCATQVVSYLAGTGAGISYRNPASALGPPTTMTGTLAAPETVTPFQPPFMPEDVVSIGRGGHLVLAFDTPVHDDPRNPYGVDLIVYGNAMFTDLFHPGGVTGFLFAEGGEIAVSADGAQWYPVPGQADGGLPTMAYLDASPYQTTPGFIPADPALAIDPAVRAEDLVGLDYAELVEIYGGACGGTRVDIADTGLPYVRFVRISVPTNAPVVPEVDAVVAARHPYAPADLNGDGVVNGADLGLLLAEWGNLSPADLNGDGVINGADLGLLLADWGA